MNIRDIPSMFGIDGNVLSITPHGHGNINQTYYVPTSSGDKYVLQGVNRSVFADVDAVMYNIEQVSNYMLETNSDSKSMNFISTISGGLLFEDPDTKQLYRLYRYMEGECIDKVMSSAQAYEIGYGLGKFHFDLRNFPRDTLKETLKGFHQTNLVFDGFMASVMCDKLKRAEQIRAEIDYIKSNQKSFGTIMTALRTREIPQRVVFGDPKCDNFIMNSLGMVEGLIDWDTLMMGSVLFDIGDAVRSACNPAGEKEQNLSKVSFDIEFFESFIYGYLSVMKDELTESEKNLIGLSAFLISIELGMRFLKDYLDGDVYFAIDEPKQNLTRARNQLYLARDIQRKCPEIGTIVHRAVGANTSFNV